MEKILSSEQMKIYENHSINELGIDGLLLMERAGLELFSALSGKFELNDKKILIICGTANNGADGLVLTRILLENKINCSVFVNYGHSQSELWQKQKAILDKISFNNYVEQITNDYDIYVDSLLGIGFSNSLDEKTIAIVNEINQVNGFKLSVDIPTGLNSSTGLPMPVAVKADMTVTFGAYKSGHFLNKAVDYCGFVKLCKIGIWNCNLAPDYFLFTDEDAKKYCYKRTNSSNKGTYGKLLIVAGSKEISGCALLCAKAAFKCGVGMVKVITHSENKQMLINALPEVMIKTYDNADEIAKEEFWKDSFEWCDSICCGPGISSDLKGKIITEKVLNSYKPAILDADALNCISLDEKLVKCFIDRVSNSKESLVITPHKKELERLQNTLKFYSFDEVFNKWNVILVEKSARTITRGSLNIINSSGNNGMSTAGSGDVLAGVIGAYLSIFSKNRIATDLIYSVATAVYIHGIAGDYMTAKTGISGLIPSDICDGLGIITDRYCL